MKNNRKSALLTFRAEPAASSRQEAVFNIGFQHGYTAGGADSLLLLHGKNANDEYRRLTERLRVVTSKAGLSAAIAIKALIEISLAVALSISLEDFSEKHFLWFRPHFFHFCHFFFLLLLF